MHEHPLAVEAVSLAWEGESTQWSKDKDVVQYAHESVSGFTVQNWEVAGIALLTFPLGKFALENGRRRNAG